MRMVYLAYPIDQRAPMASLVSAYELIDEAKKHLMGIADVIYDPGDAFSVKPSAQVGAEISAVNLSALARADAVMAFLPQGVPSVGVPIEIDRAVMSGKNVAVVNGSPGSWSLVYEAHHIEVFPYSVEGIGRALAWLENQPPAVAELREPMPVRLLDEHARLPQRAYYDDAGMDLWVSQDTLVPPGVTVDVPCGLAVQLPEWSWGLILGRSSTRRNRGLLVHPGVIDAGWRGPLFVSVENPTDAAVNVRTGERIGQLIIVRNHGMWIDPVEVDELAPHERGHNGFGSSGA